MKNECVRMDGGIPRLFRRYIMDYTLILFVNEFGKCHINLNLY